ncbi:hypothetical protein EMPS_07317 [Entomortierella parvispora]|uniref:Uncharacterized protein n=1 Tax=Entomortierella parvispora TaxID=205924 RepID=A0A9P3HDZ4_9FUNG|nr:hypothetical protein EMPS_07316 [Entomortierella parvispora]GJJ74959.1 hypothetical protein EMPS_07317 [Entomortierella parvispora]
MSPVQRHRLFNFGPALLGPGPNGLDLLAHLYCPSKTLAANLPALPRLWPQTCLPFQVFGRKPACPFQVFGRKLACPFQVFGHKLACLFKFKARPQSCLPSHGLTSALKTCRGHKPPCPPARSGPSLGLKVV